MKTHKTTMLLAVLGAAVLAGCKPASEPMPEVNSANCHFEKVKKIEDKATRETFASLCARRPVGLGRTENPKNFLEYMH